MESVVRFGIRAAIGGKDAAHPRQLAWTSLLTCALVPCPGVNFNALSRDKNDAMIDAAGNVDRLTGSAFRP